MNMPNSTGEKSYNFSKGLEFFESIEKGDEKLPSLKKKFQKIMFESEACDSFNFLCMIFRKIDVLSFSLVRNITWLARENDKNIFETALRVELKHSNSE